MLRITKGVLVLLSLGGLLFQFATLHSELNILPKEQQFKSYAKNSFSADTYLGISKLLLSPELAIINPEPKTSIVRPRLNCPEDITGLNCGDALPLPVTTLDKFIEAGASYEEFCDGIFSLSSSDIGDPKNLNYCSEVYAMIRRRYTLTDACGYSKSCLQRFVYQVDNEAPTTDCDVLADVFVDCDDSELGEQLDDWIALSMRDLQAASFDNCKETTISHDYLDGVTDDLDCEGSEGIMVTFYVNDACSQRVACHASILPRVARPELSQPHDKFGLSCGSTLPSPATTLEEFIAIGGSVEEHCGKGISISYKDIGNIEALDICSDRPIIIRRRYIVSDGCGNTRSTIQRFEYTRDTEAPTIDCGAIDQFVIDCSKALLEGEVQEWVTTMQNMIMKSATDNCGDINVSHNYTAGAASEIDCAEGNTLSVSFSVSDACGNTSQCVTEIVTNGQNESTGSGEPTIARPEVICVDDIENIHCGDDMPLSVSTIEQFKAAGGDIIQFCDGSISISSEDIGSVDNIDICTARSNILRRRYIIKDECGNEKRCLQRIRFQQDTEAPSVNCDLTNNLIIDCEAEVSEDDIDTWLEQVRSDLEASSNDNCSHVEISNDYQAGSVDAVNCEDQHELLVTYVIADECGNATSCSVSILKEENGSSGLILGNRVEQGQGSVLYQNSPNPFDEFTTINFKLDRPGKVRFTVYDLSGKLLLDRSKEHGSGLNSITINREMLNNITGVVFYSLEASDFKEVKTMIILE